MAQQTIDIGLESIPGSGESLRDAFDKINDNTDELYAHAADTSNPHDVTKAQVGLGNADDTSDADKPLSVAQTAAFAAVTATFGVVNETFQALSASLATAVGTRLARASNLGDLTDKAAARDNLELAAVASDGGFGSLTGSLQATQVPAFTGGDIVATGGDLVLTIDDHAVGNGKLAQIGAGKIKGNPGSSLGDAQDASLSAYLDFISSAQGAILIRAQTAWTALGSGTVGQIFTIGTNGPAWSTPSSGGDVSGPATATDSAIPLFDGTGKRIKDSAVLLGTAGGNVTLLNAFGALPDVVAARLTPALYYFMTL